MKNMQAFLSGLNELSKETGITIIPYSSDPYYNPMLRVCESESSLYLSYDEEKERYEVREGNPYDGELIPEVVSSVYDPDYGDGKLCECGHTYHRHFDPYEDNAPVGCKYCGCFEFEAAE